MSEWQVIWLGTMAMALVVMAIVQVGVVIVALRLSRELLETSQVLRREIPPLIEKAHRISDDAAKAAALAVAQVERVDRLLASTSHKLDETLTLVQGAILEPVRQGGALIAAIRAFAAGFRGASHPSHHRREDEEALFVG